MSHENNGAIGPGHNGGPTMEPGAGWRRHAWKRARGALLPRLPLAVIQRRLKRAAELGLDYPTYARVHASAGCDVVAMLFSNNALRMVRDSHALPVERAKKLRDVSRCGFGVLVHPPQEAAELARRIEEKGIEVSAAGDAPRLDETWSAARARLRDLLNSAGYRPGSVVLVCETALEAQWAPTAALAGHVEADRYFQP